MNQRIFISAGIFILFLTTGLLLYWFAKNPQADYSVVDQIERNLERELAKADEDLELINFVEDTFPSPNTFSYPVFGFKGSKLIFWSDNSFVPNYQQVKDTFDIGLITTGSEAYLVKKKSHDDLIFVSVIKLYKRYPINNDYLAAEYNLKILPSTSIIISEPGLTRGDDVCIKNSCIFKILLPDNTRHIDSFLVKLAALFFGIALFSFLFLGYATLPFVTKRYSEIGFLYLLVILYIIRLVMIETGFPRMFFDTPLFDPQVFASSSFNPSLADLFINLITLLFLCIYVFRNYYRFQFLKYLRGNFTSWIIGVFAALCILFASLFPVVVIQTIYNNSGITLDISQSLNFDELRVISILSVAVAGVCAFLFSHAFVRMLFNIGSAKKIVGCSFIAIAIFIAINENSHQQYLSSLIITVLYIVPIYFLSLHKRLKRLTFETFAYLFVSILYLSINGAYAIQYFTEKEKIENQFRFASNFLIDRDIFGEYLLHETLHKISEDIFIQTRIGNPFLGKETIRQKIRQVFLPSYFNKYDVDIFMFNSYGEPLDDNAIALSQFIRQYDKDSYKTGYEGVYFINDEELDIAQKYLMLIPVKRLSVTTGFVIIQLSLKKIIPENVYPELLVDYRIQQSYRTQDLSYAIFSVKDLRISSGDFNYDQLFNTSLLGEIDLYNKGLSFAGYDHIAIEDQSGRIAVVSTKEIPFFHKLSVFSFLFVMGLLIILGMIFIQGVYQYFRGSRLFFSARIQLYLNMAFFLPLMIVSVTTLSLTSRSSQQQLNNEYLNKSRIFSQQMLNYFDDNGDAESVTGRLTDLAKMSDLDANIYFPDGSLMATTQPLIYESDLISEYIDPAAYVRSQNGENIFIESEKVGQLKYFVAYSVLKSPSSGQFIGILGIPFFQSAYLLEKIQSVILINILNIFAFIFIALLVLSYVVAERLTFPLRFITHSLRRTSLTNRNTPLTWPAEDEIGLMVKEYNSMLHKLSESKEELEQTQREKAWREIAQQVAHEIKNPLTPMKLTLQQLERAVQSGKNTNEKTEKAIQTLLEQVDTLNLIASSFSGFVKMPEPVMEQVEVVSELKRMVDLHSPTGEILLKMAAKELWVEGDRQLLSRTFSNLILNALQSGIPGQEVLVYIQAEVYGQKCRLTFRDNGKGIEPNIAERIFIPHFSTKKTGSGLGLAIAKQAIEQMKGKIWFETQVNKGTTFFIELPLIS